LTSCQEARNCPRGSLDSAVLAVRDKQLFEVGGVEHTLRHALSADAEYSLARLEVYHFHGILIVTERGSKQTTAFNIHAKMIHPSRDAGHGNGLDALQGKPILGVGVARSHERQYETNDREYCLPLCHDSPHRCRLDFDDLTSLQGAEQLGHRHCANAERSTVAGSDAPYFLLAS
jgi:hypothetical protein